MSERPVTEQIRQWMLKWTPNESKILLPQLSKECFDEFSLIGGAIIALEDEVVELREPITTRCPNCNVHLTISKELSGHTIIAVRGVPKRYVCEGCGEEINPKWNPEYKFRHSRDGEWCGPVVEKE